MNGQGMDYEPGAVPGEALPLGLAGAFTKPPQEE
jgi:hypothetical protein